MSKKSKQTGGGDVPGMPQGNDFNLERGRSGTGASFPFGNNLGQKSSIKTQSKPGSMMAPHFQSNSYLNASNQASMVQ